jgi:hypothetical protein
MSVCFPNPSGFRRRKIEDSTAMGLSSGGIWGTVLLGKGIDEVLNQIRVSINCQLHQMRWPG